MNIARKFNGCYDVNDFEASENSYSNLIDNLKSYFNTPDNSNRKADVYVEIIETVKFEQEFSVVSYMRQDNLYIESVSMYDSNNKLIYQDKYEPSDNKTYRNGSVSVVPIFYYTFLEDPGCKKRGRYINSQAFCLSEAVRFKKDLEDRDTPFEFAKRYRFGKVDKDFSHFDGLYNEWNSFSKSNSNLVDIKCL